MAVSKRLRAEVMRRDNYTCRYCGATAPDVKLTIDHVVPVTLGGQDVPENLVTACVDCNAGKTSVHPDSPVISDVSQDAVRWAAALKEAARVQHEALCQNYDELNDFDRDWRDLLPNWNGEPRWRPETWMEDVQRFRVAGLSMFEIFDAVRVTSTKRGLGSRDYWRYFCGICWRKIDRLNEAARALLAVEEADG